MKQNKAFTLIELLVVISIIGILSGFVAVQLNGATDAGRDARRKADVDVLRKALVYHSVDTGGLYPIQATACTIGDTVGVNKCPTSFATAIQDYVKKLPVDPSSGYYTYQSVDGIDCTITAILSNGNIYQYSCLNRTFSTSIPLAGACGNRANTISSPYAQATTDWPTSSTYCSEGTASASPSFPTAGNSVSWNCVSAGGTSSCSAYHALNGSCGTANKTYYYPTSSFGSDTFCASGTLSATPAFPISAATSWSCSGASGGSNASCSAHYCSNGASETIWGSAGVTCSAAGGTYTYTSTTAYCVGIWKYAGIQCASEYYSGNPTTPHCKILIAGGACTAQPGESPIADCPWAGPTPWNCTTWLTMTPCRSLCN